MATSAATHFVPVGIAKSLLKVKMSCISGDVSNDIRICDTFEYTCTNQTLQTLAKRWALGSVNSHSVARGSEEAGFTQPRAHLLADP